MPPKTRKPSDDSRFFLSTGLDNHTTNGSPALAPCKAQLHLPDGRVDELPILEGTHGDQFIDIRNLSAHTGMFAFDPGFSCTASCSSAITYIDGPKGILLYRGYRAADLAEHSDFCEVCFLLLNGNLPTRSQYKKFDASMKGHMMVHEKFKEFYGGFQSSAHPMAIMVAVVGAMSAFYHDKLDWRNPAHRDMVALRIVGKMPTLAAMAYKTAIGQPIVYPKKKYTVAENFLHMMFSTPMEEYEVNPVFAKAIDKFLILHADHEQNASTATVRIAGSSQANPYACVAAGIASLWGPAHGGANEAVIDMLDKIGKIENIPQFLADVKAKKDGVRLMGFGHRVYKNFDPRATYMKKLTGEVLEACGYRDDPQLMLAVALEEAALNDPYFTARKLYPNVDFYSGIMLRAIGFPVSMYTVLFAMARSIGWITQWREMISEGQLRIGRPRQIYVGSRMREYMPDKEDPDHPDSASEASLEGEVAFDIDKYVELKTFGEFTSPRERR
ncbi:hypothetical protein FOZ61_002401 [Perkinsus olseni]|uniref:Citrate synthase n=1 Tax=Perkinsus olseni TaxID=32597 RepID=A0A7J6LT83_PEROL|nr:hypothetical protein FOZ61_002401 [Perkinsus olseni]